MKQEAKKSLRIAVFLSANGHLPESFVEAAKTLGKWIGQNGHTLVYGGSTRGLMEILAKSAKENGAHIIGVVPQILFDRGWVSSLPDEIRRTDDLTERKALLIKESDVIVALPGGIGTLDEAFTALGSQSIGYHAPSVLFWNVDDVWSHLLPLLQQLYSKNLLRNKPENILKVCNSFEELRAAIEQVHS